HRAELPGSHRILNARFEAAFLLLVADLEPEFDQQDSACGYVALDDRAQFEEPAILFLAAEAHYILHTRAVVPATVIDDDFTRGRKLLQVALHIHLGFLAVRGSGEGDDAENTRADALRDGFNSAAFAGAVASLEDEDDAQAFVFHPILELTELNLELAQL